MQGGIRMTEQSIYAQIGQRTDGNIYLAVSGPVRSGKSTFVKRFMETLVLPNIENVYKRERAMDELPQSGSGRTIMTAEPKFVPEEAVEIRPDGVTRLSVRLIDSVGYMVEGAVGATEDGQPRMVTTPWFDHEIPLTEAAEQGTRKVMQTHCTIGIVMTTDGTITDIPRADYLDAEARAIADLQQTGKPFLVLVNSADPAGSGAKQIAAQIAEQYGVTAMPVNCLTMDEDTLLAILRALLAEFPLGQLECTLPRWVDALGWDHPIKATLFDAMRQSAQTITRISQAAPAMEALGQLEQVARSTVDEIDLGTGTVRCTLTFPDGLFYQVLSEQSGFPIENDGELLTLLQQLSQVKQDYDRVSNALQEVRATGYGIVMPASEEMTLEVPEIIHKGGSYGVRLKASAPSIHMLRADIVTEISPVVGDEKQSEDLLRYLQSEYEGNTEKLWESNIFGKSLFELVNEGLNTKLKRMPEEARFKLKDTLTRIINEGSGGLICIIL
jgi:stage IV sporulation protein A